MPRSNNFSEVFKQLTSWKKYRPAASPGVGTTTVAIIRDAATITLTTGQGANFTAGDFVLVSGDGGMELSKVGSVASDVLTMDRPLLIPQSVGATVTEATETNLGHVAEDGITFGATQSSTAINAATSRVPLGYSLSAAELTFSGTLLGDNNLNFLYAFGALEDEEGAGTSADPYATVVDGTTISQEVAHALRATGSLQGGKTVEVDFLGITITVNVSRNIGGTNVTGYGVEGRCTAFLRREWT